MVGNQVAATGTEGRQKGCDIVFGIVQRVEVVGDVVGSIIVVTTGFKPSSNIGSAVVSAMYGRSSELGLYQTYTSAYLFDTLVSGLGEGVAW